MWFQKNLHIYLPILIAVVGGIVVIQVIRFADRVEHFFGKLRLGAFFRYHSGHGRHALANPLANYAVGVM